MNRMSFSLFAVYLVLYGGFVFLNAYAPSAMEVTLLGGVNLAILYGFGLILVAFILALVYGWIAVDAAQEPAPANARTEDQP